jgi:hypothetical protein
MKRLIIAVILVLIALPVQANDSAVETAAGGLRLRKENSVLMEKERLLISKKTVRVEYDFRNTTNEAVVSEVAFPIPPYKYVFDDMSRDFADFKAWIDEKPVKVQKEVRALVKGRDVTEELLKAKINIATFGGYDVSTATDQITELKPEIRKRLLNLGIVKEHKQKGKVVEYSPSWEVSIKYHWQQEFRPEKVVHIKHEYVPVAGYTQLQLQSVKKQIPDSCIAPATFNEVKKRVAKAMRKQPLGNNYFSAGWVSYILTTANTWQTPIRDFEMVIQAEKDEVISLCWDGPLEKVGESKLRTRKQDFVPTKDIKAYFFNF